MVRLELQPQGSNPTGPYPYGVLTLPNSPNLYLTQPNLKYASWIVFIFVGAIPRGWNTSCQNSYILYNIILEWNKKDMANSYRTEKYFSRFAKKELACL